MPVFLINTISNGGINFRLPLIALLLLLVAGCTNQFFIPMQQLVRTPADIGLTYNNIDFESSDGTSLHGWWLPANGKAKATILFLHGNAENISTHIGSVYWLPAAGYNVFLFDYRGYGKSEGKADIDGIMSDAEAALSTAVNLAGNKPIIVYGQSIGAAIAIYAVAHSSNRSNIKSVIIESSFSSYRDIAREKLAEHWLTWPLQYPLSWTISDRYKPLTAIKKIAPIPLLLVYSNEDKIIPINHGQQLYDAAMQPKRFWQIKNGQHIAIFSRPEQQQRLINYINSNASK